MLATRLTLLGAAFTVAAVVADAQAQGLTYRCKGKDGKKYYGATIPQQCVGEPVEVLNDRGFVVKVIDQIGDQRKREAEAAEAERRAEREAANKDIERRNRALLATYTSVKDIEDARTRALNENAQQAGRFEQKIAELRSRRGRYEKELETYKKDGKVSTTVEDNIKNIDLEIKVQEDFLTAKKKEVETINAKFDDEKKRYIEAKTRPRG